MAGLVACGAAPPVLNDDTRPPMPQELAVPAYIYPGADQAAWSRLTGSTPGVVAMVVANVVNGPDYLPSSDWAPIIRRAREAGMRVLAYVDTGYLGTTGQTTRLGSSSIDDWTAQIQQDVAAWYSFYGADIGGVFFDQMQNSCGPDDDANEQWSDRYRALTELVKKDHPGSLTVANPGIGVPECYRDAADVLITFEGSYETYKARYEPLGWNPTNPRKIWHIVYGAATTADRDDVIALSQSRGAGYLYVTDDGMANPYDTLPGDDYWSGEQAGILPPGSNASTPRPISTDVMANRVDSTYVELSWAESDPGGPSSIVAYEIYRDGVWVETVPGDRTWYRAGGLLPATSYDFAVSARDDRGNVSAPSVLSLRTKDPRPTPPAAPVAVTTSSTTYTSTTLAWSTGPKRSGVIAAFEIYRDGALILTMPPETSSVTVGGLAPGSHHDFEVRAIDDSGAASPPSTAAVATTPSLPDGRLIDAPATISSDGAITFSADFLVPFGFRRVFISSGSPGRACWPTPSTPPLCADYLIENLRLLSYSGAPGRWDWAPVRETPPTVTGTRYAWTVSLADLGNPPAMTSVFNASGYAPSTFCGVSYTCESSPTPAPGGVATG